MATVNVAIDWTMPGDGGSPLTSYDGDYKRTQDASWTTAFTDRDAASARLFTIAGLNDVHRYDFRVRATNVVGDSVWGTLLNQQLTAAANKEEQVFNILPGGTRSGDRYELLAANMQRVAIRSGWIVGNGAAYLARVRLADDAQAFASGAPGSILIRLSTSSSGSGAEAGPEFTDAFESSGEFEFTVGTNVLRFAMSDLGDSTEPYDSGRLGSSNALQLKIDAWVAAVGSMGSTAYRDATKTIKLIGPA